MLALTLAQRPDQAASLEKARYMLVTTFRHNGVGVATPVEFVELDGSFYFLTLPQSGKVKRIKHEPRALVCACTIRGKPTGHKLAASATLLKPEESAALLPAFRAKYGCVWNLLRRLRRPRSQGVRIAPV